LLLPGTIPLLRALPAISVGVIITGPGATSLTVDATTQRSGLTVTGGVVADISGLTIKGASVIGVFSSGTLTLTGMVIGPNGGGGSSPFPCVDAFSGENGGGI